MRESYRRPALRVSAACPCCGEELVLRTRRDDRSPFIGCRGFPRCRFVEPFEDLYGALLEELTELRTENVELRGELEANVPKAPGVGAVADEIKALVFQWHPDRHPDAIPSGLVVSALNRLRAMAREAA
jgi:ssDNA-binding Zn-finger/Zn-ribbon topoisomerase 1